MTTRKDKHVNGHGLNASSDAILVDKLLHDIGEDEDVRALLGTPARIFDDETRAGMYPFAVLDRHQRLDAGAATIDGAEHRVTLATFSRHGGRTEARRLLGALRTAVDRFTMHTENQRVVLAHTVYCDVLRTPDRQYFRGVLRVRIITEEV